MWRILVVHPTKMFETSSHKFLTENEDSYYAKLMVRKAHKIQTLYFCFLKNSHKKTLIFVRRVGRTFCKKHLFLKENCPKNGSVDSAQSRLLKREDARLIVGARSGGASFPRCIMFSQSHKKRFSLRETKKRQKRLELRFFKKKS